MSAVDDGRAAFARQSWTDAHALLAASESLEAGDLERLAVAAHLVGHDDEADRAWEQAHLAWVGLGDADRAACCAFWLAFGLLLRGDMAQSNGWFARATRLVDDAGRDCVARGYLQVVVGLGAVESGDPDTAAAAFDEVTVTAQRFTDRDLLAFGTLGRGQAALAAGETVRGIQLLDEVMVAVTTGEVSPLASGIVYCAVIDACIEMFDLRRATEWTAALDRWCGTQPDVVPYRGICLVHRSQLAQAHGAWADAVSEAERAHRYLARTAHPALGSALYQQGELHRLAGRFADAEGAYRAASLQGREPAPGLALLRLAEGRADAAVVAIRRMVEESRGQLTRPTMLSAGVEIMVATGEVDEARSAADELAKLADAVDSPLLRAISTYAIGSVVLAEGDAAAALGHLRHASTGWHHLEMPYDAARARVRIGLACRSLGDHDAAGLELDAAQAVFARLGALPDLAALARLARLARLTGPSGRTGRTGLAGAERPGRLTERECEVLRQVAAGKTDREIARTLVISEHTVGRHLQNIFRKLGVSSRAAATAYAYEHGLV